jgi:uroporphyrinogen III methyltransferase/synthase
MSGKVWLVGAGPGDPGLITVRGLELLRRADVVLYDALAHPALLASCSQAEQVDVGKRYGSESPSQDSINRQMIELARAGKRVVRLKGGDPFLFARGAEEAAALAAAKVPFEVVPAVSSPVAASAYAGISLTHRDLSSSVTFITGSDRSGKEWSAEAWEKLATATDTICILMGMRRIDEITRAIVAGGRAPETPVAVVQWGARANQRVVEGTLANIAERTRAEGVANPAVIIIGEVVRLRNELRWFDTQPLIGKTILVPRAREQAEASQAAIRARGAEALIFPLIELHPPPDPALLVAAAERAASFDCVVFTSQNAVERFFVALTEIGRDARAFGEARVAVIGPKTRSALRAHGIEPDVIAEDSVGEGVAEAILALGAVKKVLIPRALSAREVLPETLRAQGVQVEVVAAYETRPVSRERAAELCALLDAGKIDCVLMTSASAVASLCDLLAERAGELLGKILVASIGPITTAALVERGVRVDLTSTHASVESMLDAIEEHYR